MNETPEQEKMNGFEEWWDKHGQRIVDNNEFGEGVAKAAWNAALSAHETRVKELEKALQAEKNWSNELAADLCKIEDALGFKQDQRNPDGSFKPAMECVMEKIRDFIANDAAQKDALASCEKDKERLQVFANMVWEMRWEPNSDEQQTLFAVSAEIRSGNFNTLDAAISREREGR